METTLPKRKRLRLQNYDYSMNACYFVTLCVKDRKPIFCKIKQPDNNFSQPIIELMPEGLIVDKYINRIEKIYENVFVDNYVIMPDHIHLLISIEQPLLSANNVSLSMIIKSTKSLISKEIGESFWQKSFYDEIILDEKAYMKAEQYIDDNPAVWLSGKHSYKDIIF